MLNFKANGEQDQGVSFKGPNSSEGDSSAISGTSDLEPLESPKFSMTSALRADSFKNIGQRRRSSASNQPAVNFRRGILILKPGLHPSSRILERKRDGKKCRSIKKLKHK